MNQDKALRIIRMAEVEHLTGLKKSSIYGRISPNSKEYDPSFPQALQLGAKSVGWLECEVHAWIAERPRVRPAVPPRQPVLAA